jgi:hypothetical protein
MFENIGHLPQEETPAASAMAVHEFLYQIYSPEAVAAE